VPNDKTQMYNSRHAIHILKYRKGMIKISICKRTWHVDRFCSEL